MPPRQTVPATPQRAPGFVPPLHRLGSRSPVRKVRELSGASRRAEPVLQFASPVTSRLYVLKTQVLVAVLAGFGRGSGAPNLQPRLVQVSMSPVPVLVVGLGSRVSPVQQATSITRALLESGFVSGSVSVPDPLPM